MKDKFYRDAIDNAGYKVSDDFVEKLKSEHEKLLTYAIIDKVHKELRRAKKEAGNTSVEPEKATKDKPIKP